MVHSKRRGQAKAWNSSALSKAEHLHAVSELVWQAHLSARVQELQSLRPMFPDLRGGARPEDAKLLAGLAELLRSVQGPATPSPSRDATQAPAESRRVNRRKRRKANKDNTLIGNLKRLVERMSKPGFDGDPIKRLSTFNAVESKKRSGSAHAEKEVSKGLHKSRVKEKSAPREKTKARE